MSGTNTRQVEFITPEALFDYAEERAKIIRSLCRNTQSSEMFSSLLKREFSQSISGLANRFILQTDTKEPIVVVLMLVSHMYKAIPEGSIHRVWGMDVLIHFAIKRGIPLDKLSELTEELV